MIGVMFKKNCMKNGHSVYVKKNTLIQRMYNSACCSIFFKNKISKKKNNINISIITQYHKKIVKKKKYTLKSWLDTH